MARTNKHYMRDYSSKRRKERKEWAKKEWGNKCTQCSSKEKLQFDHRDRKTKTMNISNMWMYSWPIFLAEFTKCQLLCEKCHILKSRIDGSKKKRGETKHGTGTAYVHHKCRCEKCVEWKSEYSRKERQSRQVA